MSSEEGFYLYGIVASNKQQDLGPLGIGGRGDRVYTIVYQNIAAIVSRSPIIKYHVTRDNVQAHTRVLETVARAHTVLPVRFCTIAKNEEMIVSHLLKTRYQEFIDLAREMEGKIELGVRARWKDMDAIFTEVAEENKSIKMLKEASLREKNQQIKYANSIKIGEMVKKALEQKRKREAQQVLEAIKPLCLTYKESPIYGDMNLFNATFLVRKTQENDFDEKTNSLQDKYQDRILLIYTTSIVPYSFVELVVTW